MDYNIDRKKKKKKKNYVKICEFLFLGMNKPESIMDILCAYELFNVMDLVLGSTWRGFRLVVPGRVVDLSMVRKTKSLCDQYTGSLFFWMSEHTYID